MVFITWDTSQWKKLVIYENINSANSLYLIIGEVDGYVEESNSNKYLVFVSTDKKKKEVLRNTHNLRMGLQMRLRQ